MERAKILVVEDNEDNRRILVLRLQRLGAFAIREATTGQEALDHITRDPPDILFLDLTLPGLDGWETARRIRALPGPLSQLPIVAVSAHALAGDREKALAVGCDEYITKPIVNPGEIQEKLQQLLAHGRPTRPAGAASLSDAAGSIVAPDGGGRLSAGARSRSHPRNQERFHPR